MPQRSAESLVDQEQPGYEPTAARLLIFDLDGTLIDSSADLCQSVNAALRHIGREPLPDEQITSFIGDGAATLMLRALAASSSAPAATASMQDGDFSRAFAYFLEYYREHKLDRTLPYPGVLDSLRAIREQRPTLLMAVLTNKPVRPAREICEGLGLAPFFFAIYGGDSQAKKPDPQGIYKIMAEADSHLTTSTGEVSPIEPAAVVMIGDSPVDVLTAKNAGVPCLGCTYGLAPEALVAARPGLLVESPHEWISALRL